MEYGISLKNPKTLPLAKIILGMLAAAIVAALAVTLAPARENKAKIYSWVVASEDHRTCDPTEDPYDTLKKMRAVGWEPEVTKHDKNDRYSLRWKRDGRFMEKNVYESRVACEYDQKYSR